MRVRYRKVDFALAYPLAIAVLLTVFTFYVVQNSVVINVRLAYFVNAMDEISMRLATALILAGGIGFFTGWLASEWCRLLRNRRSQQRAVPGFSQEIQDGEVIGDDGIDLEQGQLIDSRQTLHRPGEDQQIVVF